MKDVGLVLLLQRFHALDRLLDFIPFFRDSYLLVREF